MTSWCLFYSTPLDQFWMFKLIRSMLFRFSCGVTLFFPPYTFRSVPNVYTYLFHVLHVAYYTFFRFSYYVMLYFLFYNVKSVPNAQTYLSHFLQVLLRCHAAFLLYTSRSVPVPTVRTYPFHVLQVLLWRHDVLSTLRLQISPECLNLSVPCFQVLLWRHDVFSTLHS